MARDFAEAERLYRSAIEADPDHAEAHWFLGRLAEQDQRWEEAIGLYRRAAELQPEEVIYQAHLGYALLSVRDFKEAGEVLAAACALQPDFVDVQINLAAALIEQNRREEVRVLLERLCETHPHVSQAHFNLGGIYREYGRIPEAVERFRRCLELVPDHVTSRSNLLLMLSYGARYSPREILEEHRKFGEQFARPYVVPQLDRAWPRRLRVGYVSPDFRRHVVAHFIEPLLANHDHGAVEVFCYHSHPEKDDFTARLRGYADHWRDCESWSDAELDRCIREDRIDILVDLAGHTGHNRLLAFATKPAPVQATYLGYPGVTGLAAMDWQITDAYADPVEEDAPGVERKARLPGSYFCYRPAERTPEPGPFPAQGRAGVVFGCFNNFPKISPEFVAAAARILKAVPGSRLLMKSRPLSVESVRERLLAAFAAHGVGPAQLDLRRWEAGYGDHLKIYHEVDIALDSFPYNGATTTCEALWMGVPVVTVAGDRHAARMGSSLLNAMRLQELVAKDVDGYVETARALAAQPGRLAALRKELRARMERSPLRDEVAFARKFEALYLQMWEDALRRADAAVSTAPVEAFVAEARRARAEGRFADADAAARRALASRPDEAEALQILCDVSFEAGAPGAAIDPLRRAIAANGAVGSFHYLLGTVLQAQGKLQDALDCLGRAVELDPGLAKAHNNMGCILDAAGYLPQAIGCFEQAVRLDPSVPEAHYNLGNSYRQAGALDKAMESMERAVALQPANAEWRSNLSELQYVHWKFDEAIEGLRIAQRADPAHALVHRNLAASLLMTGRVDEALEVLSAPGLARPDADVGTARLLARHYLPHDPRALFEEHVAWAARHASGVPRFKVHAARRRGRHERLNIGYVSPDFRAHPVAHFIEPVLAAHDRSRVRVFCYATLGGGDATTERLRKSCDYWRDLSSLTDDAAAERIRADGIDVLVDLAGHTPGARPRLFARKPAPVQAGWIGYPDTTGLPAVDYRITDAVADPPGRTEAFHVEKLARLDGGFLCYRPPEHAPSPAAAPPALAAGAVTFGCFNVLPKVSPDAVALWAELLRAKPGSRLLLKSFGLAAASARSRLQALFAQHGIDAQRVVLLGPERTAEGHLARYHEVDIALDTFPYNGTTTTCEALWMGVPVVTLAGHTHVSRVGASLLAAAGLGDLVAETPQEYMAKALALANDTSRLAALRSTLREQLRNSRLLDAARFTRGLEGELERMARAAGLAAATA